MAFLGACSMFSDSKDLPQGQRIAVLEEINTGNDVFKPVSAGAIKPAYINSNWAQTGGNAAHLMGNLSVGSQMNLLWSESYGKGASTRNLLMAQPVVGNGLVLTQDVNSSISAFDLQNGKRLWRQKLKPAQKNAASNGLNGVGLAVSDRMVYAVAGYGSVSALDIKDGKILWQKDLNMPLRTAPALCGDKLLIQTLDNRLFALNTSDGEENWKYNISAEDTVFAGGAVPACSMENNLTVAGFSNGEIQAFNTGIGYPLWSANLVNMKKINSSSQINAIKASPVIDGNVIYALGKDLTAALDARTGEFLWTRDFGGSNMPWMIENQLYVLSDENELYALNKTTGETLWRTELLTDYEPKEKREIYLSGPVMINSMLIITASNGEVFSFSPLNGEKAGQFSVKDGLPFSPIAAENILIFVTDEAQINAYQ